MLTPKGQSPVQKLFAPGSPIEFIGFAVITAILGLLSAGNLVGFIFVPLFAVIWWLIDRWLIKKRTAATTLAIVKEQPTPAKGLILLLSPYDPRLGSLGRAPSLKHLISNIVNTPLPTESDFAAINLMGSNLKPQIQAVDYHTGQQNLRDVWLISTATYEGVEGSETAAMIFEKYLYWRYGKQLLTIYREGLTVKEYDYAGLCHLGEKIFRQSNYKDEVLVADITGGNKMMSMALAMACIPPKRRMQYMDARRDWQGNPIPAGELSPVLIDIDPILYSQEEELK